VKQERAFAAEGLSQESWKERRSSMARKSEGLIRVAFQFSNLPLWMGSGS